jgi:uncharacterized membrane protein
MPTGGNPTHGVTVTKEEILYSGPIPDPETLARYGEIVPSAPERILTMAEKFADHRIRVENRASWTESIQRVGSFLASTGIALYAITAGRQLIEQGHDAKGLATIIGTLVVLFGALRAAAATRNTPTRQQRRAQVRGDV